jgi:hypothetical protein
MKIINLNESQYSRLFESVTDQDFGTSTIPEYDGLDKVELQPTITDKDGSPKKANPMDTEKFADAQSPQQWGAVGGRKSSNTI